MEPLTAGLDPIAIARLISFRDLLLRWNQRFNLTSLEDPDEIDRRLIADSLRMLPAVDAALAKVHDERRLIDIGSGAGVPGLMLAITRPELVVTLVESTGKKATFLREAIGELGLSQTRVVHARAEELARDLDHRTQHDVATARAVGSLPALLELSMPFLREGGRALFPKGPEIDEELAEGRRAAKLVGGTIATWDMLPDVPGAPVTRLVVAIKIGSTPERYPRRPGIPARESLSGGQSGDRTHLLPEREAPRRLLGVPNRRRLAGGAVGFFRAPRIAPPVHLLPAARGRGAYSVRCEATRADGG
jgi:16S rRNA (guanine527-N7)-methyltransferase